MFIQIIEEGFDNGDGVDWTRTIRYPVESPNRRRILDREHRNSNTPSADGWLYMRTDHGDFTHVQRIRWIDEKWVAPTTSWRPRRCHHCQQTTTETERRTA